MNERSHKPSSSNYKFMFKNYLKGALRSLLKRKVFTAINILGLATGMTVCLLIILFIRSELGYDNFEPNADRIYRVVLERKYPERSTSYSIIPQSIGGAIQKEFPEVAVSTGLLDLSGKDNFLVKIGDQPFEEKNVLAADSNFFPVFSIPLLSGDTPPPLQKPNMALIHQPNPIKPIV